MVESIRSALSWLFTQHAVVLAILAIRINANSDSVAGTKTFRFKVLSRVHVTAEPVVEWLMHIFYVWFEPVLEWLLDIVYALFDLNLLGLSILMELAQQGTPAWICQIQLRDRAARYFSCLLGLLFVNPFGLGQAKQLDELERLLRDEHAREVARIKADQKQEVERIQEEKGLAVQKTTERLERELSAEQERNKKLANGHKEATHALSDERESKRKLIDEYDKAARNLKIEYQRGDQAQRKKIRALQEKLTKKENGGSSPVARQDDLIKSLKDSHQNEISSLKVGHQLTLDTQRQKLREIKQELSEQKTLNNRLGKEHQAEVKGLNSNHDFSIETKNKEIAEMRKQLSEQKSLLHRLKKDHDAETKCLKRNHDLAIKAAAEKGVEELDKKLQENNDLWTEQFNKAHKGYEAKIEVKDHELNELRQALAAKAQDSQTLQDKTSSLIEYAVGGYVELREGLPDYESWMNDATSQEDSPRDVAELEAVGVDNQTPSAEVQELQQYKAAIEDQLCELKKNVEDVEKIKETLQAKEGELDHTMDLLKSKEKELADLKHEGNGWREGLDAAKESAKEKEKELETLKKANIGLGDGLDKVNDSLKEKEEELQNLNNENDELRNQLNEINEAEKAAADEEVAQVKQRLNETTHRSLQHQEKVHDLLGWNDFLERTLLCNGIPIPVMPIRNADTWYSVPAIPQPAPPHSPQPPRFINHNTPEFGQSNRPLNAQAPPFEPPGGHPPPQQPYPNLPPTQQPSWPQDQQPPQNFIGNQFSSNPSHFGH